MLPPEYLDANGTSLIGKPDFLCRQQRGFTFIEYKDGRLNHQLTHESSRAALQSVYEQYAGKLSIEPLSHSFLSSFLWNSPARRACIEHGFNHSLFKVAALQAEHGWQRYIVCFKSNPTKADAERYLDAGLVFCTLKNVESLLRTIELAQHGFFVPFQFVARSYSFTVTPDHRDCGKPAETIRASDRAKFLSAVQQSECLSF